MISPSSRLRGELERSAAEWRVSLHTYFRNVTHGLVTLSNAFSICSDSNCDAIQDYMKDITGGRSVPRVFM